jgi:hypothetical protein
MNGLEDNVKRFTLSSSPFIKGLLLFSLRGGEFSDHQTREFTPDECFNPKTGSCSISVEKLIGPRVQWLPVVLKGGSIPFQASNLYRI